MEVNRALVNPAPAYLNQPDAASTTEDKGLG